MKNIYEDGNDRSNMEDIGSGSAPLSDDANAKPNNLPPQNSDSLFVKAAQNPQPANPQPANPGTSIPNLTPEQIAALFGQFLSQLSANSQPPQTASPQAAVSGQKPPEPNDTGKRILFQSEDFDERPAQKETEALRLEQADPDSERKKSFYDDDEIFDRAGQTVTSAPSTVKMTDFGDSFQIAEVDIDSEDLPELPKKPQVRPKPQAPAVMHTGSRQETVHRSRTPEGKAFAVPTPSEETGKSALPNPIYPTRPQVLAPAYTPPVTSAPVRSPGSFTSTDVEEEPPKPQPGKKKKPSDIIRIVVLSVSIIAIVVASGVLIREYKLHKDNEKLEAEISNLIIEDNTTTTVPKTTAKAEKPQKTTAAPTTAAPLTPEQKWAQIKAEYPNVIFPPNLQYKYAKLYATNQDFVGYLSADGVGLSLPVVQTTDDEKYLSKNFYGKTTKYGCPFVTHLNNIEMLDMNTVIFGHHMNDGTVFGALDKYKTIEGFKKAPVITFNTLYKNYKWKVIAAFITNAYEKDDNGYVFRYYFTSLSSEERYAAYLNELAQRSLYDTGVDVLPSDKILTLSTCSHEFEDARFVVVARLVRKGESEAVDVNKASENTNPRYPQAYYDKKKQKNPYANATQWQVG